MSHVTLFSQIIHKIDRTLFNILVADKQTDKVCKGFNSWNHLVSMLFCHLAKSTFVRDISNVLRSATGNLNHLGVNRAPSKSSISYQNERRDADLFKELYYSQLKRLGQQASQKRVKLRVKVPVYLFDATVISLCLSVFDWPTFRRSKGAVKMHTLLEYDVKMPAYVNITEGSVGDNKGAYQIPWRKGAFIVADRYYNDFPMRNIWDSKGVYFVIRHKNNLAYHSLRERELPYNTAQHVLKDEAIELAHFTSKQKYPKQLRRIAVWDDENEQTIELITNNFKWSAQTIADLYKARWEIEYSFGISSNYCISKPSSVHLKMQ